MSPRWTAPTSRESSGNLLLDSLPGPARQALLADSEVASVPRGHILSEEGHHLAYVYFPTAGLISGWKHLSDGSGAEALTVGSEGMVGLPLGLGLRDALLTHSVQIPADIIRVPAAIFQRVAARYTVIQRALLLYVDFILRMVAQAVVCARLHGIEERLARWLLWAQDRVAAPRLPVTHEFLAQALGTYRPTVSVTVNRLKEAGVIRASRGGLAILTREGLLEAACECYAAMRHSFNVYRAALHRR